MRCGGMLYDESPDDPEELGVDAQITGAINKDSAVKPRDETSTAPDDDVRQISRIQDRGAIPGHGQL